MPTRTADEYPFAPRRTLTRDDLQAYADGRLPPQRMHEVEQALEADALTRETVEGLRMPGASAGLKALDAVRPEGASTINGWAIGALVVAVGLGAWALLKPSDARVEPEESAVGVSVPETMPPLRTEEITAAHEQPESLLIGHEDRALHAARTLRQPNRVDPEPLARDEGIAPMSSRPTTVDRRADIAVPRVERKRKSSRQLVFLHGLKLVHPQELYTADPVLALADAGVAARFADAASARATNEAMMMGYLDFMEGAIARFAASEHKGCLDDLRFVLNQYPDDVNALFYAGLCSYNLGLYARASTLLQRAATHPVDVFDEEAVWYGALTKERLDDNDAARAAFERIAAQGGFYAASARARLAR